MVGEKERIFILNSMNETVGEGLIKEGKELEEILRDFEKIRKILICLEW